MFPLEKHLFLESTEDVSLTLRANLPRGEVKYGGDAEYEGGFGSTLSVTVPSLKSASRWPLYVVGAEMQDP